MTEVAVHDLTRTYPGRPPVPALRGVDLELPSGSLTAVLGPSGCGKTTLLRILAGFDRPDGGTVAFDGDEVSSQTRALPPERRRVGIVPQEGALFPHLDVGANVAFGLPRRERGRGRRTGRVAEVLELVGLSGFERRRAHELSGGQQQRVALARALAPHPALVLLDEPFTALDAGLRGTLRADVSATLAAAGATALLVTHDQAEALSMADHLAVMRAGRIVQSGPPADVYHRPADVQVATFLGEAVLIPGRAGAAGVTCALGVVAVADDSPGPASGDVTVCLRPEQVVRADDARVKATVVHTSYHGHDALLELDVAGQAVAARWASTTLPHPGEEVGVTVTGTAVTFAP
ncbi:ABC transporter ATP-binding protein [Iamia sp.]|uniref:ABC transporter ATP-binding protein n=1 Tax=Iamia sp. TaxID=2722710 RepID=UPI002C873178|nr:ABC transporter ATP-binding protein [Iamia sp.]HXH59122.1 ABC transporter ATP-binding protein [Iamia sp.]